MQRMILMSWLRGYRELFPHKIPQQLLVEFKRSFVQKALTFFIFFFFFIFSWWNSVVKTGSSVYLLLRFCAHDCREESKYMLSQIILLPALFLFTVQSFTIVPAAMSETHDLGARLFVATVAVWLLFWFGKIILVWKSALADRLPVMSVLFSAKFQ